MTFQEMAADSRRIADRFRAQAVECRGWAADYDRAADGAIASVSRPRYEELLRMANDRRIAAERYEQLAERFDMHAKRQEAM